MIRIVATGGARCIARHWMREHREHEGHAALVVGGKT
jgi:hypothetical protein